MDVSAFLVWDALPEYLAVAGMLALAVGLLALDFNRTVNRVFSLFLVVRAVTMLSSSFVVLANVAGDIAAAHYWALVTPYTALVVPGALLAFACFYPRHRGKRRVQGILGAIILVTLAAEAAYLLDHSLWATWLTGEGVIRIANRGPLYLALGAFSLASAIVAWVMAEDYRKLPPGPRRRSVLLVTLGLSLNALYDATGAALILVGGTPFDPIANDYVVAAAILPLAVAWFRLATAPEFPETPAVRRRVRRALGTLALPPLTAAGALYLGWDDLGLVAVGTWRLVFPALVTYALVRYDLFGLDLRLRWTLERSTMVSIFAAAFFMAKEGLEQVVPVEGAVTGIVAAGAIALLFRPVQRTGERLAEAVMPGVEDTEDYQENRRREVYRAAVESAFIDQEVTDREERVLGTLQDELDLPDGEADRIEDEVARSIGPGPDPVVSAAGGS